MYTCIAKTSTTTDPTTTTMKPLVIRRYNKPEPDNNTVVVNQKTSQGKAPYQKLDTNLSLILQGVLYVF